MPPTWTNKTVVITGASEGIGRALASAMAGAGARVVVAARKAEALEGVAAACREAGGDALAVPTDVADEDACRRLIATAVERFGGIDVLVNNAGISMSGRTATRHDPTAGEARFYWSDLHDERGARQPRAAPAPGGPTLQPSALGLAFGRCSLSQASAARSA